MVDFNHFENNSRIINLLWLCLQLKAISNYFKPLLFIDEKEKIKYKHMFDSFVELTKIKPNCYYLIPKNQVSEM
ncbi:MAG: hypothetical protein BGO44_04340 [Legionella sp. 39-23]|nr:MAG: hypothetical protein BGO44_04340 [Legionella sp. 39-23]